MNVVEVLSIIVESLVISSLYALVAIGFTLIFGVGGQLNIAHGANVTITSLGTVALIGIGINFEVAFATTLFLILIFNAVLYVVFVKGIQYKYDKLETQEIMTMIVTLLIYLIVEQSFRITMGSYQRAVPSIIEGRMDIAGVTVTNNLVLAFILSWIVIALLYIFITYTWTGRALMASTMSERGSVMIGVDLDRLRLLTWVIAGLLAAVAGIFIGSIETAVYSMGRDPLIISFAIVVLGGLGSIKGSVIGAYIIGTMEILTTSLISTRLTGMAAFIVLILVLVIKPQGLFGRDLSSG
jgi:branched-chain amino acid transport system permease protein